jgi:hypothetical protein
MTEIPVTISALSTGILFKRMTFSLAFLSRAWIPIAANVPKKALMTVADKATAKEVMMDIYKDLLVKISLYHSNVTPVKVLPVLEESIDRTKIIMMGRYRMKMTRAMNKPLSIEETVILFFFILNNRFSFLIKLTK